MTDFLYLNNLFLILSARGRQVITVMDDYNSTEVYFHREKVTSK